MSEQFIQEVISTHKVAVFSKTNCPYCHKAKAALGQLLTPDKYFVVELDKRDDCNAILEAMLGITGGRTVPRVFVGGKFIGGGDDTARLAQSGELKTLLEGGDGINFAMYAGAMQAVYYDPPASKLNVEQESKQ